MLSKWCSNCGSYAVRLSLAWICLGVDLLIHSVAYAAQSHVQVDTSMGSFTLRLFNEQAPKTVSNFLRYVNEGFYRDTLIHRVISDRLIQGGSFTVGMEQKPTHEPIANEAHLGLKNRFGTIAMARVQDDPHSATAGFFINVNYNTPYDHKDKTPFLWGYAVFGEVVDGLDTLRRIADSPTHRQETYPHLSHFPKTAIVIHQMTMVANDDADALGGERGE